MLLKTKIASMLATGALLFVTTGAVFAGERGIGTPPPPDVRAHILALSEANLRAGIDSFERGDFDRAREFFDTATDAFLSAGYDMRADPDLQAAYRETVEKIHRFQTIGVNAEGDTVWPLQDYEATTDDFRPQDLPTNADMIAAEGDWVNAAFLVRIAELQRRFQGKFGRSFTVTGRDTGVHTRLYGNGHAIDVRVSDLTENHVQYIVQQGRALNMRVLDFSTYERVAAHNARVIELGRPLDTLATGIHLHLNDQPRAAKYTAVPAGKTKTAKK